jgi:nucleoside-diphosphate-sugar epimerase
MRILLIGGNGFIGCHVAATLRERGHRVAIFHRGSAPLPPGVEAIRGNRNHLSDSARDLERFAPEVVIDMVISSGAQAEELMNAFRNITELIVMRSSMDVYKAVGITHGTEAGPVQELPLAEDSELRHNLHPYPPEAMQMMRKIFTWATDDYDKIPAERVVMNDDVLSGVVLRLPMVYGPGDPLHRFYPIVKRIADERRQIIFSEPQAAWRSPHGFLGNVAAAIALAATDDRAAHRIYNICEEPCFSELEWARKIADEMQWSGEFLVLPPERTPPHLVQPGNYAQHWAASSARIRRELEYAEPIALEEAIRQTIRWELTNAPTASAAVFDYASEDAAPANF